MSTSITKKIATALAVIFLSTTAISATAYAAKERPIKSTTLSPFRKISVKGNVEVILIQNGNFGINYADDNFGNARVTQQGDILHIISHSNEKTKFFVYVNDIYRIEAGDNAVVKTAGKLKFQFLQVFLRENASADINTETSSIYTCIADNAQVTLGGSTKSHCLIASNTSKIILNNFDALKTSINSLTNQITEEGIPTNAMLTPKQPLVLAKNPVSTKN
ncbi:GIN domain-containing protein [Pedobacter sp. N23S346]|uniref:GIN domain-containing protein n=1 Tax=Pedobacter sp. N23S346 TaxID=3402750 RepID=UPI003AD2AF2E